MQFYATPQCSLSSCQYHCYFRLFKVYFAVHWVSQYCTNSVKYLGVGDTVSYSLRLFKHVKKHYRAVILKWRISRRNSWPNCVAISRDIARYGSNSYFDSRGSRKMLDPLLLKLMFSLLDSMRYLPIINYTKPPI